MDQLRALKYFVKVVETGSFTQAAASFGVPPSSLSRRVADLEASLGATLLKRSTRVVNVTEVGQLYYQQVSELLSRLEESAEAVRSYQARPTGQLKISSMVGFGEQILIPLMEKFSEQYPEIVLDIRLSDELSKLDRDDVDLAIRGGYAPDERVIATKLMENEFILLGSPKYLEKHGIPKDPFELRDHRGIHFRTPIGTIPWLCQIDGEWHDVTGETVAISNNGKWIRELVEQGKGLTMIPRWTVQPELKSGSLVELKFDSPLAISQSSGFAIYMLYQKHRYVVPKIKAAVDFLIAETASINQAIYPD